MLEPNNMKADPSSAAMGATPPPPHLAPPSSLGNATSDIMAYTPQPFVGVSNQPQDDRVYRGTHPIAAFFHILFKGAALLSFILGGIFSSDFVVIFVVTVLFLAADFWTTKNVSGRLLVSLRWWNDVREDGTTQWVFESSPHANSRVNSFDKWFFWMTTGGNFFAWILMVIFNLMSFSVLPMAVLGAVLGGANFIGFLKCSRDAKKKMTNFMLTRAAQHPDLLRQAMGAL